MTLDSRVQIRQSFSRAAESYVGAASHQQNVARELAELLAKHLNENVLRLNASEHEEAPMVVDLGSGTGFVSLALEKNATIESVSRLDISESMLKQDPGFSGEKNFVCADIQELPFKSDSVDLLVSSYACQWSQNWQALFDEFWRVLKPGASVYFAVPGERTFEELNLAWQSVDDGVHVHRFVDHESLLAMAWNTGFTRQHFSQSLDILPFQRQRQALQHIKAIGAHNLDKARSKHLLGKSQYFEFSKAFKACSRLEAAYSLSYQSYFFAFTKTLQGEGSE